MSAENPRKPDTKNIRDRAYERAHSGVTAEWVDRSARLLGPESPTRGIWARYLQRVNPVPAGPGPSLYEGLGILQPKWAGLVEHNLTVSAGAHTAAEMVGVDPSIAEQAGAVQDAGKRYDLEDKRKTREVLGDETVLLEKYVGTGEKAENLDTHVIDQMRRTGVADVAIVAALNTGRLPDRYLKGHDRMDAIAKRGLASNVVAYVDARTIDSSVVTLDEAQEHYLKVKPDPKSQEFFKEHWLDYFKDVERYLIEASGGTFNPADLNNEAILAKVKALVPEPPTTK